MKKLILALIILQVSCASAYRDDYKDERSRSKYFDGKQFHNSVANNMRLWDFLKMRMSENYPEWPKWIESSYGKINPQRVSENEIHLTHINHSTVLIQIGGLNILTDPIYSERCSPVSWLGPRRVRNPGIRFEDLPPIDIVLISHDHYDHLDLPTIEKLRASNDVKFFMGLGVGERFPRGSNITELDWWESTVINENLKISFVPVQHFSGRGLFDRNSTLWGGFVIEARRENETTRIYFGGDTGYADHFKKTREKFGSMHISLLPIGAFEPRYFMSYAHLDPAQAVQAHLDLDSRLSIGIHYGTFQLSKEKIDDPISQLKVAMAERNMSPESFLVPNFGEVLKVSPLDGLSK